MAENQGAAAGQAAEQQKKLLHSVINRSQAAKQAEKWQQQFDEVKVEYPDADMERLLADPKAKTLLKAGIDMKTVYEVSNLEAVKEQAAYKAEQRLMQSIKSGMARPVENGITTHRGAPLTPGGGKMSRKERQEIVKRSLKGEKIEL